VNTLFFHPEQIDYTPLISGVLALNGMNGSTIVQAPLQAAFFL